MVKHQCHRMTMSSENARRKSASGLRWARLTRFAIAPPHLLPTHLGPASMVRLTVRVHDMNMGTAVQVRPAVRHRARRRRLWALGVAIALLVISNYMSNRVIPQ